MKPAERYPAVLLLVFGAIWIALAIAPSYRQDWLLENILVAKRKDAQEVRRIVDQLAASGRKELL